MAEQKKPPFRGGRKKERDRWFGYADPEFRHWWHRVGKRQRGQGDLKSKAEADEAYEMFRKDGTNVK
jgi:hypothetical protein